MLEVGIFEDVQVPAVSKSDSGLTILTVFSLLPPVQELSKSSTVLCSLSSALE